MLKLHAHLQSQGINVSAGEIKRKFYGPSTRSAIIELQKKNGLAATGEIDHLYRYSYIKFRTERTPAHGIQRTTAVSSIFCSNYNAFQHQFRQIQNGASHRSPVGGIESVIKDEGVKTKIRNGFC